MTTMIIEEDSLQARKFIEYGRTLPFVTIEEPVERISGVPYTREGLIESVRLAEKNIVAGRVITLRELKEDVARWK